MADGGGGGGGSWYENEVADILSRAVPTDELNALGASMELKRAHASTAGKKTFNLEDHLRPDFPDLSPIVRTYRADITCLEVDAIVNGANESLLGGGGIDGAIHTAAGPLLQRECAMAGLCPTGEARITHGYRLLARYVIHTVAPYFDADGNPQPDLLRACHRSIYALVDAYGIRSVAIPPIGTGFYGFDVDDAARIAVEEAFAYLSDSSKAARVDAIVLCGIGWRRAGAFHAALADHLGADVVPERMGLEADPDTPTAAPQTPCLA